MSEVENSSVSITMDDVLGRLQKSVSQFDARLILDSAVVVSGLRVKKDQQLSKIEAETICLELIRKGGPAFQVGTQIYREVLQ